MKFTTRLLHDTFAPDAATGATTQPIYQSSAFYQPTAEDMERVFAGKKPGFVYTRVGNPTIAGFERRVNALEGGVGAVACASGMAAVSQAVLNILSQGAEILASGGLYGGTSSLFRDFAQYGITVRYAAGDRVEDFAEELFNSFMRPGAFQVTKMYKMQDRPAASKKSMQFYCTFC